MNVGRDIEILLDINVDILKLDGISNIHIDIQDNLKELKIRNSQLQF